MTLTHEVQFADFDPNAGMPAGEAAMQELAPTAEALGAAALPVTGLYFADREPKASDVARHQLNREVGQTEAERRRARQENQEARRDVQSDPDATGASDSS